jgi:hypothetical protein
MQPRQDGIHRPWCPRKAASRVRVLLTRRAQLRRIAIAAMTIEATPTTSAAMNQFVRIGNESSAPAVANDPISRVSELLHQAARRTTRSTASPMATIRAGRLGMRTGCSSCPSFPICCPHVACAATSCTRSWSSTPSTRRPSARSDGRTGTRRDLSSGSARECPRHESNMRTRFRKQAVLRKPL